MNDVDSVDIAMRNKTAIEHQHIFLANSGHTFFLFEVRTIIWLSRKKQKSPASSRRGPFDLIPQNGFGHVFSPAPKKVTNMGPKFRGHDLKKLAVEHLHIVEVIMQAEDDDHVGHKSHLF